MTEVDVQQVKDWLDRLPGEARVDRYAKRWDEFNSMTKPVVTVFGSYDTGKSSLIRRILVDSGVAVPDWLTISGRHETFEVNQVDWAGCILRDTPGLAVGADDARGESNTELAEEAVAVTDVAVVTVTPQLATGEREVLRQLIGRGWTVNTLWLVISRFDEAGIDPDDDLDGYRLLAGRKIAELRESLGTSVDFPVHVVSQDFAQFAGAARAVDPGIWDDSREWDGMGTLERDLERIGEGDYSSLRRMTEQRYWNEVVRSVIANLQLDLAEAEGLLVSAEAATDRHQQSLVTLDGIDSAARADLRGELGRTVRTVFAGGMRDTEAVLADVQSTLDEWFAKHSRNLDRLLQDATRSAERRSRQPSWQKLEEVASALRDEIHTDEAPGMEAIAPIVNKFGTVFIGALREYARHHPDGPPLGNNAVGGTRTASSFGAGVEFAAAVLPIAVEIVGMIDGYRAKRGAEEQERKVVKAQEDRLTTKATELALGSWVDVVVEVRSEIVEIEGVAVSSLAAGLRDSVDRLRAAIVEGTRMSV